MLTLSELKRRLENIVQIGTISETKSKDGKSLARVILDDDGTNKRVSAFLPVVSLANSFGKVWFPIRVKEQVIVFSPFGNADSGFIIRSIFNKSCKEPSGANEHTSIIEFEDGTVISYDSKASVFELDAVKSVNIICKTATVTADSTTINSTSTHNGDVTINGKLTVSQLITGGNGLTITGGASTGGATFECDIKTTKDIEANNIKANGEITDSKGNLTNHTNYGYSRD